MKKFRKIDDSILSAYIDGMLDDENIETVIEAMEADIEVRERVYRLRKTKDLMKLGFANAKPPGRHHHHTLAYKYLAGAGASLLLLVIGYSAGVYTNSSLIKTDPAKLAQNTYVKEKKDRVILHINDSDPKLFSAALDYVETTLKDKKQTDYQLAVIASTEGVDLFRKGKSSHEKKLLSLLSQYDNLSLIACGSAVKELEAKGIAPNLLPNVILDKSAVSEIIERLQHGWQYQKIESLII